MKRSDFYYELPAGLIAQRPLARRTDSRLMTVDITGGFVGHHRFAELPSLLHANDLLVFNDTRVIPARLFGRKETGGKLEILVERLTGTHTALVQIRASKSPRPGTAIFLSVSAGAPAGPHRLRVAAREGDLYRLSSEGGMPLASILAQLGHMPLPPYIERADEPVDRERYQTVYGRREGAVAAPTAGLHFSRSLLDEIDARGIRRASVTLHVGAGTFQPVREEEIERHHMHAEYLEVDDSVCAAVAQTRARGGRVVAVGTTAVRALETASGPNGELQPRSSDTDIFIFPGYRFRCVDAMVTNFHLPESSLLMLVSAFAGRDLIMRAYASAIESGYRFFSYGDAMFIAANQRLRSDS